MNISNYCTNEEPPSDSSQPLSSTFFQIIEFETIFAKGYLYPKGTYLTQHFKYLIAIETISSLRKQKLIQGRLQVALASNHISLILNGHLDF